MSYAKGLSLALALVMVSSGLSNASAGPIKNNASAGPINKVRGITPKVYISDRMKHKVKGKTPKTFTKGALADGGGTVFTVDRFGRLHHKPVPTNSPLSPASRFMDTSNPQTHPVGGPSHWLSTGTASQRAR